VVFLAKSLCPAVVLPVRLECRCQWQRFLLWRCLHESDSWSEALHNLGSGSWLAWANDIAAHYAAIHCPRQRTIREQQQTYHRLNEPN